VSDWSDDGYYDVCFSIERARRYHSKMRAFYEWCHNLARVAMALSGTASFFVVLAKDLDIAKYLTGIVAVGASIDSVFRFERKARLHDQLAQEFTALAARIAEWDPTPVNLRKARSGRLKIEAREPPVRRLIDLQAQNEEARSRGISPIDLVPLSPLQRVLGYVVTFGVGRLEAWHANRSGNSEPVAPIQGDGDHQAAG
jgi:hypothetical protein